MIKLNLTLMVVLLVSATTFVSCKKEKVKPPLTRHQLLMAHPWRLTALKLNGVDIETLGNNYDCAKDNKITYTDSLEITDEGASNCNPADPKVYSNKYYLKNNSNIFVWGANEEEYTIAVLNETEFVLTVPLQSGVLEMKCMKY